MARGGARPGAGRKPGGVNRISAAARKAAKATGKLPHEILLDVARGLPLPGRNRKPDEDQQMDALKAAAPFYAPRLSAVAAKVNDPTNPWQEIFDAVDGRSRGLPASPDPEGD